MRRYSAFLSFLPFGPNPPLCTPPKITEKKLLHPNLWWGTAPLQSQGQTWKSGKAAVFQHQIHYLETRHFPNWLVFTVWSNFQFYFGDLGSPHGWNIYWDANSGPQSHRNAIYYFFSAMLIDQGYYSNWRNVSVKMFIVNIAIKRFSGEIKCYIFFIWIKILWDIKSYFKMCLFFLMLF